MTDIDYNLLSEEAQLAVLVRNPFAIKYIANPSEKVQLAAVNQTAYAIGYIANPTNNVKEAHKKKWDSLPFLFKV